jgi:hypothetical protein
VQPRLTDLEPEAVAAWRDAADALDEPLAVSRLGDLFWDVKVQNHGQTCVPGRPRTPTGCSLRKKPGR